MPKLCYNMLETEGKPLDGIVEQNISPQAKSGQAFRVACIVSAFTSIFMSVSAMILQFLNPNLIFVIFFFVFAGLSIALFYFRDLRDVEYDLVLIDDELTVSKIIGKKRRKDLFAVKSTSWDYLGPVDQGFARYAADKSIRVHMLMFGQQEDLYYLAFRDHHVQHVLVFVPEEKMKSALKRLFDRGRRIG